MDGWINIISNQWCRTLATHDITWILLWTKFIIKRTKMSLMQKQFHQLYCFNFLISEYLSFNQQSHSHYKWNKNIIDGSFSRFFKSKYLKYIKYIHSEQKYELSISNKMWQHVFRSGSRIIYFHIFVFSVLYLVYTFFLLLCGNYPLTSKSGRCRNLL